MTTQVLIAPHVAERSKQTNPKKKPFVCWTRAVTEPPDPSAYQGHKSSAEAEMYCESAAWGTVARALRHPPTLPESAVSVATSAEGGGGRCSLEVKGDKQLRPAGGRRTDGRPDILRDGPIKGRGKGSMGSRGGFDRLTVSGRQQQQHPQ